MFYEKEALARSQFEMKIHEMNNAISQTEIRKTYFTVFCFSLFTNTKKNSWKF